MAAKQQEPKISTKDIKDPMGFLRKSVGLQDGNEDNKKPIKDEVEEEDIDEEDIEEEKKVIPALVEEKDVEEEEGEEEEDDKDLDLTLDDSKKKPKGTQIQELRASKDKWKKQAEDLKRENEKLSKAASPESIEVISVLEEKFGSLGGNLKEKVEVLAKALEERDSIKTEYESFKRDRDIRETEEWKTEYETPYNDSLEAGYAYIVNFDDEGKVPNEEVFKKFYGALVTSSLEAGEVNATQVKSALTKFAKAYENETGEEYEAPSISDVTKSIRSIINTSRRANEAYADWESKAKGAKENQKLQEAEKSERLKSIERRERKDMAAKALRSFDFDSIEDIIDRDDIVKEFNDVFKLNESQILGEEKPISYGDLIALQAKGRMFDVLLSKYKKDLEDLKEQETLSTGVKGSSKAKPNQASKSVGSWLKV